MCISTKDKMDIDALNEYLNKLNPEQYSAATYGAGGVLVLAAAGSGKTSTLTSRIAYLIGMKNVQPHNILAVTFTNKAAKEMNQRLYKMGIDTKSLWIGTFHGICNKILRYHAVEAGLRKNFYIMDQQEQLSFLKRALRANGYDPKTVNADELQDKINGYKEVGWRSNQLRIGSLERKYYQLYEEACVNDNCVDFAELMLGCYELFKNHKDIEDSYAEKFQYILVDEFQDTNELQYKWLTKLAGHHGNVFAVGDDDQCLPEGSKISTPHGKVPIEQVNVGDIVLSKIGSHTVEKTVTEKFEKVYEGNLIEITLDNDTIIQSTPEHTWFANFIKKYSPQKYFTYLMYKKEFGFRIGISRMHSGSESLIGVHQRGQHEHADKMWIISHHDNEEDSRYSEIKYSLLFGIPTIPFVSRQHKNNKVNTVVSNQQLLEKLFKELNTYEKGQQLLKELALDFNKPHHIPRSRNASKNNIVLTLCSEKRGKNALHSLEYFTNLFQNKELLEKNGFTVENHKSDKLFRLRMTSMDYGYLSEKADCLNDILEDVNIICKAKVNSSRYLQKHASHIIPGMIMIDEDGKERIVISVKKITAKTKIYDLNIENTHNYIANGIVTHNSIYSFRGAKPENLNLFKADFNAKLIKIEKNYRSDAYVLAAANAVIAHNTNRQGKNLVPTKPGKQLINMYAAFNDEQESMFIATEMKKLRRALIPYKEMAILYRTNAQSRSLEKALNAQNIPYIVYGGFRFFDRQEVKHAMAYLRLAHNPNDNMAFLRVANIPARAIGETALKKLDALATTNKCSLYEMAKQLDAKTFKKYEPFITVIDNIQTYCKKKTLPDMVRIILEYSGLEKMYEDDKKDGEERLDNLYELISAAEVFMAENPKSDIDEFLAFSTLDSDVKTNKRDENIDAVKLMTVHASKGLEFEAVFIAGMEESLFPHTNSLGDPVAIEEERRLMYVAITRAKTALYISYCEERLLHGQRNRFMKSRFLKEIPIKLIQKLN